MQLKTCLIVSLCLLTPLAAQDDTPAPAEKKDSNISKVRFLMMDGSVLHGEIDLKELTVDTKYGELAIPISDIHSVIPGLSSKPELRELIATHIDTLGSGGVDERDKSEKALIKMGLPVRDEVLKFKGDEDLERKSRVERILKALDEIAEEYEAEDDTGSMPKPWVHPDILEAAEFTVRGDVTPKEFEITTRFGRMKIRMEDILSMKRLRSDGRSMTKNINITQDAIAQKNWKYSGLEVMEGDSVRVNASGELTMTPWGGNKRCGPEGSSQYGWYNQSQQIYSGTLVARIGKSGKIMKIGARKNFKVKKGGRLYFAVGMNASYINYSYPGAYKVRIQVK